MAIMRGHPHLDHDACLRPCLQARIDAPCFSDVDRLSFLVRCASNYISGEDDVSAERFIRRAGDLIHRLPPGDVDPVLGMKYRAAYAQMLDQKRRFLDAGQRYLELMRQAASVPGVGAGELTDMLEKAATCAILAPAGPQRQRVMATLMREEGIASVNVRGATRSIHPISPPARCRPRHACCHTLPPAPSIHPSIHPRMHPPACSLSWRACWSGCSRSVSSCRATSRRLWRRWRPTSARRVRTGCPSSSGRSWSTTS